MPIPTVFTLLFGMVFLLPAFTSSHLINSVENRDSLNKSGLEFYVYSSNINTKYSELPSAIFKDKLILVSSKKIGGLGNGIDTHTNEPFTELFCLDLDEYGTAKNPLLFSRIINTRNNEGHVAFSPDETTIYFTRSLRENSQNYQLYKAELEPKSDGNWMNEEQLLVSDIDYSIENPHMSADGKHLYFASNMPGTFGGFDLYVADVSQDGSLHNVTNLGPKVNTKYDDECPYVSKDGKKLFFSSQGHKAIGGFDIFVSSISNKQYDTPRNLGSEINSKFDEVSFLFTDSNKGFFSSNKSNNGGSFDMYRFKANVIYQQLQGIVVNEDNQPLPNTVVLLLNEQGEEIARQTTGIDAHYSFKVRAYENYAIKALRKGFKNFESHFSSHKTDVIIYKEVLKLSPKVSTITNE